MNNAIQSPLSILCEWAWTKVNLESLQVEGNPALVLPAIVAFRHALRKKRKLDMEHREHHEALLGLENKQMEMELT